MPLAPDDLPRSPTGRVPQWVFDESTGRATAPTGWQPADPAAPGVIPHPTPHPIPGTTPRRHSRWPGAVAVLAVVAVGAWGFLGGSVPLSEAIGSAPWNRSDDTPVSPPTAEVVALADAAHLSDEGRTLFYGTAPQLLDAAAFGTSCAQGQPSVPVRADGAVGCYDPVGHTIVLYRPSDARLQGFVVETAAHETLHAAWERLTADERSTLTPLLEAEAATFAADDPILEQIAGSVGTHPENRPTELFAYLGTQVWRDGGLDPQLEAVYARFVADRSALVAVHTAWQGMLDQLVTDVDTASQALVDQEYANASARAQLDADTTAVAGYRQKYDAKRAEVDAMSADERALLQLSWVWWDGTELPMRAADQTLAAAADLLARDEASLADRNATLATAEATAAAERTRIEALVADVNALQAQLDPASA